MSLTRRRLLFVGMTAPLAAALEPAAALADDVERKLAAVRRPPAEGTSDTRCAACGGADHHMLQPCCPAHPRVRS